ncbi:Site-specific recombinase XerD [Mucilaginibacter pineti]|uniref:Site-specific recombinase XerD n=1 Tax=Mucilaginibacter pineti TaxID=1391627 RepID=A0A1G7IKD6_9SPHI|nr:site-specific integrase [Mucilaginibacter pineti]SDF12996.1 Site-specific recombinase XerD [Mucilaginibacter pineti]
MLEKSFGLLFFLKASKSQSVPNLRTVYLRITVDGNSKELSTKRNWPQSRWSQSAGRATGTKEDVKSLNAYLDLLASQVYQAKLKLIESQKPVTAEALKNLMTGEGDNKHMILEAFKLHNEQMKALVGTEFAPATLMRYKTAYAHTKAFVKWKYDKEDFDINELNYEFVSQFAFWLKSERKCAHNATVKYIGNLKKIVLECMKKGWLVKDPFANFKTNKKEVHRIALTKEELKAIANKKFGVERLNYVRDIFLFSCYTGLAYIDVYQLRRSDIITGVDDGQWIITTRQKTESATRIPLLPQALEIMEKYKDDVRCAARGLVLPVLTNQKMNSYLKEIGDSCDISNALTFHIARHTFATTVTLSNGVPIETVSKMLGHKSLKQTQQYAKIVDLKISEDMQRLRDKLQ